MGGDEIFHEIDQVYKHNLSLLIKMIQSSGKPLPIGSYTERLVTQKLHRIAGVQPPGVTVMNERDATVELRKVDPTVEVFQLMHGLISLEGQSVDVSCLMSSKSSLPSIVQVGEEAQDRQKELERDQQLIRHEVKERQLELIHEQQML